MSTVEKSKTRSQAIDMAKGIGLLCVIAAHSDLPLNALHILFYAFHLPLFFVCSGWFFNADAAGTVPVAAYIRRKAGSLLKPYLVMGLLIALYMAASTGWQNFFPILLNFALQIRYSTLWFLGVLFWANIFFFLLFRRFQTRKKVVTASCCLSAVMILYDSFVRLSLPWNMDTACVVLVFLAAGFYLREKTEEMARDRRKARLLSGFGMAACAALTLVNHLLGFHYLEMYWNHYGIFPITMLAALCGSFSVILFCHTVQWGWLSRLGQNSLVYFGLHQAVALPEANRILERMPIDNPWLRFFIRVGLMLVMCFAMDRLLSWLKIKQWMLGK